MEKIVIKRNGIKRILKKFASFGIVLVLLIGPASFAFDSGDSTIFEKTYTENSLQSSIHDDYNFERMSEEGMCPELMAELRQYHGIEEEYQVLNIVDDSGRGFQVGDEVRLTLHRTSLEGGEIEVYVPRSFSLNYQRSKEGQFDTSHAGFSYEENESGESILQINYDEKGSGGPTLIGSFFFLAEEEGEFEIEAYATSGAFNITSITILPKGTIERSKEYFTTEEEMAKCKEMCLTKCREKWEGECPEECEKECPEECVEVCLAECCIAKEIERPEVSNHDCILVPCPKYGQNGNLICEQYGHDCNSQGLTLEDFEKMGYFVNPLARFGTAAMPTNREGEIPMTHPIVMPMHHTGFRPLNCASIVNPLSKMGEVLLPMAEPLINNPDLLPLLSTCRVVQTAAEFANAYGDNDVRRIILAANITDNWASSFVVPQRRESIEINGQGVRDLILGTDGRYHPEVTGAYALTIRAERSLRIADVGAENAGQRHFHITGLHLHTSGGSVLGSGADLGGSWGLVNGCVAAVGEFDWVETGHRSRYWVFHFGNIVTLPHRAEPWRGVDSAAPNPQRIARIARINRAQGHFYGVLRLHTTAENFYIGGADVAPDTWWSGMTSHHNYSVHWFTNPAAHSGTGDQRMIVRENAVVQLRNNTSGTWFPAVYQHFNHFQVRPGARVDLNMAGRSVVFNDGGHGGNLPTLIEVMGGGYLNATSRGQAPILAFDNATTNTAPNNALGAPSFGSTFRANPGSEVFFIGDTGTGVSEGIIDLSDGTGNTVEFLSPHRFDVRNNSTQGNAVRSGANSTFRITNSDISIWRLRSFQSDLSGEAWHYSHGVENFEATSDSAIFGAAANNQTLNISDPELHKAMRPSGTTDGVAPGGMPGGRLPSGSLNGTMHFARISGFNMNPETHWIRAATSSDYEFVGRVIAGWTPDDMGLREDGTVGEMPIFASANQVRVDLIDTFGRTFSAPNTEGGYVSFTIPDQFQKAGEEMFFRANRGICRDCHDCRAMRPHQLPGISAISECGSCVECSHCLQFGDYEDCKKTIPCPHCLITSEGIQEQYGCTTCNHTGFIEDNTWSCEGVICNNCALRCEPPWVECGCSRNPAQDCRCTYEIIEEGVPVIFSRCRCAHRVNPTVVVDVTPPIHTRANIGFNSGRLGEGTPFGGSTHTIRGNVGRENLWEADKIRVILVGSGGDTPSFREETDVASDGSWAFSRLPGDHPGRPAGAGNLPELVEGQRIQIFLNDSSGEIITAMPQPLPLPNQFETDNSLFNFGVAPTGLFNRDYFPNPLGEIINKVHEGGIGNQQGTTGYTNFGYPLGSAARWPEAPWWIVEKDPGAIYLQVPTSFDFGRHPVLSTEAVRMIPVATYVGETLGVFDTRATKEEWQVRVSMLAEGAFEHMAGGTVQVQLRRGGNAVSIVPGGGSVPVFGIHTNTADFFDIWQTWYGDDTGDGLFIKVPQGSVRLGTYEGVLNWTLVNGPSLEP